MSDAVATPGSVSPSAAAAGPSTAAAKPAAGGRQVLEFEKPLAQLESQVRELEVAQGARGVDYSVEIRQLRTNYVSLLKKTYENLSAWETVQVARHPGPAAVQGLRRPDLPRVPRAARRRRFGDDRAISAAWPARRATRSC
jgi:acetyl-CoA carboxylase carboxyl transferase subunit alpha